MNIRYVFCFAVLLFCHALCATAGDFNYAVSAIPEKLKENANAVLRFSHTEISINSPGEITVKRRYIITVLNDKGTVYGLLRELQDNYVKVEHVSGTLYNGEGDELKSLKKYEIKDVSPFSHNLIDDFHYKFYDFACKNYPYTCVYEIETSINNFTRIPEWQPQENFDCSVEHADLEITYPKDFPFRYRGFHVDLLSPPREADEGYLFKASVNNLAGAEKPDNFAITEPFYLPTIIFATDKFVMEDKEGSMATWKDYGKFFYTLNDHRDVLPAGVKKTVHQLTDTCTEVHRKINLLYDYLKTNTRYVSIQLGIGGWQTFDAEFVAEKGYGDCKALSNYMKALLKEAGITAYQVLAFAGEDDSRTMIPDFPSNVFNHVIVCVPQKEDTIWIECTSKTLPAGYLSSFTDNRDVLMLTPYGGILVKTPQNKPEFNQLRRSADIVIDDKDEIKGSVKMKYSGYFWEKEYHHVTDESKSKVDNYLNGKFRLGSYTIGNYKITENKNSKIPDLEESISITGEGNLSRNQQHLFLSPRIFGMHITPPSLDIRKEPFELHHSSEIVDTIIFHLPANYQLEHNGGSNLDYPFASYTFHAEVINKNILKVTIAYKQKSGVYPPEQFADYIRLYKQLSTDDDTKLVLNKVE